MSPKPKPGHAKRRSTSPITATYLYNEPVAPAATATTPQVSFDASVFATVTGAAPLADSPAAAPVMRPPPTAAARLPAAAATAPDRASKLSHLSAEAAAAEKARLIKEQVYASFIKGGVPCGKQPSRGFGHFALQHAPPAPDQARGGLQPQSALANWQIHLQLASGIVSIQVPVHHQRAFLDSSVAQDMLVE